MWNCYYCLLMHASLVHGLSSSSDVAVDISSLNKVIAPFCGTDTVANNETSCTGHNHCDKYREGTH